MPGDPVLLTARKIAMQVHAERGASQQRLWSIERGEQAEGVRCRRVRIDDHTELFIHPADADLAERVDQVLAAAPGLSGGLQNEG